jgi:adenylate cyclase
MSPEAVRAQLDRLLASELFSSAGRHSRLLRYLVERTLAGEGDQLKEYVLGTDVFDRSDAYDPRIDSIVRVEVRRLRSRIEEYYRGPGAGDPIVIAVPRGSYVPTFTEALTPASATASTAAAPAASGPPIVAPVVREARSLRSLAIIGTAVAAIVGLVAILLIYVDRSPAAEASPKPSIAVLPFEHYSTGEQDAQLAASLTDSVTTSLARLGTLSVASRTSASRYLGEARPIVEIAQALNVQLVVESTVTVTGDDLELAVRLVDGVRDRKVWVGDYTGSRRGLPALARAIARDVAAAAHRHGES